MNFLIPIGVSAVLLAGIAYQQHRLEKKAEELSDWKAAVVEYEAADEANKLAIAECKRLSDENKIEAETQRANADKAAMRVVTLREQLEQRMEAIDAPSIMGDCPAANDPAYGDWLYNASAQGGD